MDTNYRTQLFSRYNEIHGSMLDGDFLLKEAWFDAYVKDNYLPHVTLDSVSTILDIGCNKGFLMRSISKHAKNISLTGIDLDESDLSVAKALNQGADLFHGDLSSFCSNCCEKFDLITCKAVLEHVPKSDVLQFIEDIKSLMHSNSVLLLDVPNMAWLFSGHERYMDFTHEVGFTKESLGQVLRSADLRCVIYPLDHARYRSLKGRIYRFFSRLIFKIVIKGCDPEGGSNDLFARSILARATL